MKYPNIKTAKLSHAQIAKAFGYANVKSFRTSSAHKRHMIGLDKCIEICNENRTQTFDPQSKEMQRAYRKFTKEISIKINS